MTSPPPTYQPDLRFRLRLLASCALLVGLALTQSAGLLVADTKLDLAVAPAEFLSRALHLWDAEGAFGQLQNQAYGYLWPMGPFFLVGSLLGLPEWVVQRLWIALVMCVAMVGAAKVSRALGVRSDLACLLGGFAFALSPRMLTTLGPISIEAWPSAVAPWVLLPLVLGAQRGSPLRAAALSGFAVAMVGGVNAAATFAVLPLGALWLLTREKGPRRSTMMRWWPVFTLLGTFWWLVPLFLLGSYSPPFLDFIEAAGNTTFPTTVFDALRGTSNWVPYVDSTWRAGNDLVRDFYLPINSGVLLVVGLWGISLRGNPHRAFLILGVVTGLFGVTMGHLGSVHGWAAADLQALLDGVLAPLRNVHKFDPVVRLPLVIGLTFFVDTAVAKLRDTPRPPRVRGGRLADRVRPETLRRFNLLVAVGTTVVAVAGAALPAAAGRITPAGGFQAFPGYWAETAAWLAEEYDGGTALLVPGSSFGRYVWGYPRDEPIQSLATTPWAVRNAVPLTPAGSIRMLDAVERVLLQGTPSEGLATYLRRAGVSHLVVRNDLALSGDGPGPVVVHQALDGSPGLRRVAVFGPEVGGEAHLKEGERGRIVVNGGWQNEYPAVEVYEVEGPVARAVQGEAPPVVAGGPEDLLDLTTLGLLGDQPTVLAADVNGEVDATQPLILTDGLRFAERHFGRVHDGLSATLSADDPLRLDAPARDYLPPGTDPWTTQAEVEGVEALTASSSMSDASAFGTLQPGQLPFAAVDGDPDTAWVSNWGSRDPGWWQLDFERVRGVRTVTIRAGKDARELVRVRTENSTVDDIRLPAGSAKTVTVDDPGTAWLRIEDASGRPNNRYSLAEVDVPGLEVDRSLVLPGLPASWGVPDAVVLRRLGDARTGCVEVDRALRCVQGREVVGEEPGGFRRIVPLSGAAEYDAGLSARPRPGEPMESLLTQGLPAGISASSTGNAELRASALAAVDGDPGTTWTSSLNVFRPVLRLNWLGKRRVTGLRMQVAADTAARLPERVTVIWPGGRVRAPVEDGVVSFPPIVTDRLAVLVRTAEPATSLGFDAIASPVPVGISELRVRGVPFYPIVLSAREVRLPCGSGPTVVVNGVRLESSVTATPRELYAGGDQPAELCGTGVVRLHDGANAVDAQPSELFVPQTLVLADGPVAAAGEASLPLQAEGSSSSTLSGLSGLGGDGDSGAVAVRANTNIGWVAEQDGGTLPRVVLDGWQQGWRLDGSEAPVRLHYAPDETYRTGLLVGLMCLVVLTAFAAVPGRFWRDQAPAPVGARLLSAGGAGLVALVMGGLLAGWPGLACAAGGFLAGLVVARRTGDVAGGVVAAVVLPAALAYAVRPWGDAAGWAGDWSWPHYLVVVACAGMLGSVAADADRLPRSFRRMPGFSTKR